MSQQQEEFTLIPNQVFIVTTGILNEAQISKLEEELGGLNTRYHLVSPETELRTYLDLEFFLGNFRNLIQEEFVPTPLPEEVEKDVDTRAEDNTE